MDGGGGVMSNSHMHTCIYCDVPGSPCLSKKGESSVRFVSFQIFFMSR